MSAEILKIIEDNGVKFVDFRFTDTHGKEQHVSVPAHTVCSKMEKCLTAHLSRDGKA